MCVCVASEPGQFLSPFCILARHQQFLLLYDNDSETFSFYIALSIKIDSNMLQMLLNEVEMD